MLTHVPPALYVPDPTSHVDARRAHDELQLVVVEALHDIVRAHLLTTAQLFVPALGDAAVVAGQAGGAGTGVMFVQKYQVDVGAGEAGRGLLVTTSHHRSDLAGVASMLGRLVASEVSRQQSARAAHGALLIANRDPDTALGNRRAWVTALRIEAARAVRSRRSSAIVVVDLDGLKETNDRLGHAAGDDLIRRTAESLLAARREADVLCRIGGDEFAVLAPETMPSQVEPLLARLRHVLTAADIKASLGAALLFPGGDTLQVWHDADAAMYADKSARRTT